MVWIPKMLERAFENFDDGLSYFFAMNRKLLNTRSVRDEIQRNMFYLQRMSSLIQNSGNTELYEKINTALQEYFTKFQTM